MAAPQVGDYKKVTTTRRSGRGGSSRSYYNYQVFDGNTWVDTPTKPVTGRDITGTSASGTPAASSPPKPETIKPLSSIAASTTAALRYPEDLADTHADWVSFSFYKYKSAFAVTNSGDQSTTAGFLESYNAVSYEKSDIKPIALYMPEDISAFYGATWGGRDFSPLGAALLSTMGQSLNTPGDKGSVTQFAQTAVKSVDNLKGGLLPQIAAGAVAFAMNGLPGFGGGVNANDVLASTQGRILNPNTEVLYSGTQLRTFGLKFKMVPRDAKESSTIKDICNSFKKASLPKGSQGDARNLIGVPDIVQILFKHKNQNNEWVSQFKTCAIGSVDINYTADGAWSTYVGGAPTAVMLSLQFNELKILYSEEIDQGY
jgi:hypothetical protein